MAYKKGIGIQDVLKATNNVLNPWDKDLFACRRKKEKKADTFVPAHTMRDE